MGRKPAAGQTAFDFLSFLPPTAVGAGRSTPKREATASAPKREARPAPTAVVGPGPLDFIPPEGASRADRLLLALKRDLATLDGPAEYICDRAFYEQRAASYRAMLAEEAGI